LFKYPKRSWLLNNAKVWKIFLVADHINDAFFSDFITKKEKIRLRQSAGKWAGSYKSKALCTGGSTDTYVSTKRKRMPTSSRPAPTRRRRDPLPALPAPPRQLGTSVAPGRARLTPSSARRPRRARRAARGRRGGRGVGAWPPRCTACTKPAEREGKTDGHGTALAFPQRRHQRRAVGFTRQLRLVAGCRGEKHRAASVATLSDGSARGGAPWQRRQPRAGSEGLAGAGSALRVLLAELQFLQPQRSALRALRQSASLRNGHLVF